MRATLRPDRQRFVPSEYLGDFEEQGPPSLKVRGSRSYFDIAHNVVVARKPLSKTAPRPRGLIGALLSRLGFRC